MFSIIILYDVKYKIIKIEKYHNINLHVLETTATGGVTNNKHRNLKYSDYYKFIPVISIKLLLSSNDSLNVTQ